MLNTELFKPSSGKISEALELLNEAAKEKREELTGLLKDKYSHIKQAVTAGKDYSKEVFDKTKELAGDVLVKGKEKAKEVAVQMDQRVRKDPWTFIAAAAVVSIAAGYLIARRK